MQTAVLSLASTLVNNAHHTRTRKPNHICNEAFEDNIRDESVTVTIYLIRILPSL